jgi:DNA-binding XRE family transcriptional regulator
MLPGEVGMRLALVGSERAFTMVVGQRLRELRQAQDCSQDALAHALGVKRQTIAQMESGAIRMTLWRAVQLARFLGVEVGDLLSKDAEAEVVEAVAELVPEVDRAIMKKYLGGAGK